MAEISKITLPSGAAYDIKDAQARQDIADIRNAMAGGVNLLGLTTTELTDGATVATITINSADHVAVKGDLAVYAAKEFIFDGTKWLEFGDLGAFKALAYKDQATANYTPAGSVSQPTFSGDETTSTGKFTPAGNVTMSVGTGTANYTPAGSVSKPDVDLTPATDDVYSITDVGTLPSLSATVADENLTLSFNAGTLPTKGTAQSVLTGITATLHEAPTFTGIGAELKASFSGTQGDVSVKGTPSGSVTQPTFTGTEATITVD